MTTKVNICNLALAKIACGRIPSIDDASAEARACKAIFDSMRDEVLEAFPWTFARARATLSQSATAPAFGWTYAYLLPTDCLRPLSILEADGGLSVPYVIEGRELLTDSETVNLRYTKRADDPAVYTSSFAACLATRMAAELASTLLKSPKMYLQMYDIYTKTVKGFELQNAVYDQMETDVAMAESNPYLEAR